MNTPGSNLISNSFDKMDHVIGLLTNDLKMSKSVLKDMVECLNGQYTPTDKKKLLERVKKTLSRIEKNEPKIIID